MTARWFRLGTCLPLLVCPACENQGAGVGGDFIDEACALHVEAVERRGCPNTIDSDEVERSCRAQQLRVLNRCSEELRAVDDCFSAFIQRRIEDQMTELDCKPRDMDCIESAHQVVFTNTRIFECVIDQAGINYTGDTKVISTGVTEALKAAREYDCWTPTVTTLSACSAGRWQS
jgi:hypothetical protein